MVLTWGLLVWIEVSRPLSQWFSAWAAQNYVKSYKSPSAQTASETDYIRASGGKHQWFLGTCVRAPR